MVKVFPHKKKSSPPKHDFIVNDKKADAEEIIFFVYVEWSEDKRAIKTYIKTESLENECYMICNGLADLVADPDMKMNNKNIKMAVLYKLDDEHDTSKNYDVTGVVPTRLDHYLNSDPEKRINFSQEQIEALVNNAKFTRRALAS